MIEHFSHVLSDDEGLRQFLGAKNLADAHERSSAALVQIYLADTQGDATAHVANIVS